MFDECVKEKLGIDRPPYDHYVQAHIHKTTRPRPPKEGPAVYPDATPGLPADAPLPEAKFGQRSYW